ncbi:MAG: GNAT family N-acetyltransferase [Armatimonas sp.]
MIRITHYEPQDLTRPILERLQPLREAIHAEKSPDDPPPTVENLERQLASIPSHVHPETWIASLPDGTIVGAATLVTFDTEGQKHLADGRVEVLPSYRRKGLGRRLYSLLGARSRDRGRNTLIGVSYGRMPSGGAFMTAIGAHPGLTERESILVLAGVDKDQLQTWEAQIDGFTPVWWDDRCPEEHIDEYARVTAIFNDVPSGDINIGDHRRTPELLRAEEEARIGSGHTRWTLAVRDDATGHLIALTEIFFSTHRPGIVQQGITGVEKSARGKGLGRYIKAVMLQKLLSERPDIREVRTENATQNDAMRHINDALGFRLKDEAVIWQLDL